MKLLILLLAFITAVAVYTDANAHEDPLQIPWPKGEKVPCRCDILAMDYELCLKGIGRKECFKESKKEPVKPCGKATS